jgi:hypothetical protein
MADLQAFFSQYLPKKLADNPDLCDEINAIYQFDLEGFGTWTADLKTDGGAVIEGTVEEPDCVVTALAEDFDQLLENPDAGMMLFVNGKLQVSNVSLALSLQKILG